MLPVTCLPSSSPPRCSWEYLSPPSCRGDDADRDELQRLGGRANEGKPIDETVGRHQGGRRRHRRHPGDADRRRDLYRGPLSAGGESRAKAIAEGARVPLTTTRPRTMPPTGRTRFSAVSDRRGDPERHRRRDRRRRTDGLRLQPPPRRLAYQPYQLLGIEYGDFPFLTTAEEAVKAATERGAPRSRSSGRTSRRLPPQTRPSSSATSTSRPTGLDGGRRRGGPASDRRFLSDDARDRGRGLRRRLPRRLAR